MYENEFLSETDEELALQYCTTPMHMLDTILSEFVVKRPDLLTDCLLNPSQRVKTYREENKELLNKVLTKYLNYYAAFLEKSEQEVVRDQWSGYRRNNHEYYFYFLNLGALYLALENYNEAARCFNIAMNYPRKNKQSETDNFFQLPCLLAASSLELSGNYEGALELYRQGQNSYFKTYQGKKNYVNGIQRCENKLAQGSPTPVLHYKQSEQNELRKLIDSTDFSKKALYERLSMKVPDKAKSSYQSFTQSCWNGFSTLDNWRLYVDGAQQSDMLEQGWLGWESREPGSIKAMDDVFSYIKTYGNKPVGEDTIRNLHRIAMQGVSGLNGREATGNELVKGGEYRTTEVGFHLYLGHNATQNGLNLLSQRRELGGGGSI